MRVYTEILSVHTYIPSQGLKRSRRSWPRRVNGGNKNTPSLHHPRRQNVTTSMVGLKNSHIHKNLTQIGEPQRSSWGTQKQKMGICQQEKHTHHAPPKNTECDFLYGWTKRSNIQIISPRTLIPWNPAQNTEESKRNMRFNEIREITFVLQTARNIILCQDTCEPIIFQTWYGAKHY